ncbi:MAG: sodium/solute symporter [Candidatus Omnitrophica bacterium]|nr:sodium/solute symporter [Candidatus Omnitrophota bacterium]
MLAITLLVVFLASMLYIGLWGMKKTSTLSDFFLGGRTIGPWISAFAYGTTYFSAVIFIGFAGKLGWGFGLNALWIAAGNAFIGSLLAWFVLGRRTRRMSQNLECMTMPEFLHERFGGRYLKIASAIIIFVFLLPYSASVFKGLGHLFEAAFHMPYEYALLIMIGITGIYLIMGGYFAITLTDFIQGMVMLVGSIAMVSILVSKAGGFGYVLGSLPDLYIQHVPAAKQPSLWLLAALVFMTSFGPWGLPQMVQKFYAIKDEKMIYKAAIVSTLFAIVITFAAYFTGALSHAFNSTVPLTASGKPAFDQIIPGLLVTHLPSILMAVILLLVLSASMSTLSSLVLVSASAIAIDLYKGHVNPAISKENSLVMMRFLSGVFIVISYFIARYDFAFIVTLMSLSWGCVAGSFMAPFLYALYWKKTTLLGVQAGMITGLTLGIVLFFALGQNNSPIASSIAMIVPFAVVPAVSAITKKPNARILEKAFAGIAK